MSHDPTLAGFIFFVLLRFRQSLIVAPAERDVTIESFQRDDIFPCTAGLKDPV